MLTKPTLRTTIKQGILKLGFLNANNNSHSSLVNKFAHISKETVGKRFSEFEEMCKIASEGGAQNYKISLGLQKILTDNIETSDLATSDLQSFRHETFSKSFDLLKNQKKVAKTFSSQGENDFKTNFGLSYSQTQEKLYSDLPMFQTIQKCKPFEPLELLEKYNEALFFGVLIHTKAAELIFENCQKLQMQEIFLLIKKHSLLASSIKSSPKNENTVCILLEGPLNILLEGQKYGLNFSRFIRDICYLNNGKIYAIVSFNRGSTANYEQNFAELPFARFKKTNSTENSELGTLVSYLNEQKTQFKFELCSETLSEFQNPHCIPDFVAEHGQKKVYFEIIQPWQETIVHSRLDQQQKYNAQSKANKNSQQIFLYLCVSRKIIQKNSKFFETFIENGSVIPMTSFPTATALLKSLHFKN